MKSLRRRITFDEALDVPTQDFTNIHIYNRGALQYKSSFFYTPVVEDEVADPNFDSRHERVLGQMRAAVSAMQTASERHQQNANNTFMGAMPTHAGVHEATQTQTTTASTGTQARAQTRSSGTQSQEPFGPMLDSQSFAERLKRRRESFKQPESFDYRKDVQRLRQEARIKADRAVTMSERRKKPDSSPPPSPSTHRPPKSLQAKYDKRFAKATSFRNPVKRPATS